MELGLSKALGRDGLPPVARVQGQDYRLIHAYKHSLVSAVGLYRSGPDQVIIKCYRTKPFLFLPMRWAGGLMARYETSVMRKVDDLECVPDFVCRFGRTGIVREFVPGEPLTRRSTVDDLFFPRLQQALEEIHRRDLAYVDLEKASNVLLGSDGRPYLIDFQVAFSWPRRLLGHTWLIRCTRRAFQRSDLYHLRKHWRRVRPDQLTEEELTVSRTKPWPVRFGNVCMKPVKSIHRALFGRA